MNQRTTESDRGNASSNPAERRRRVNKRAEPIAGGSINYRRAYFVRMLALPLLDWGVTGIFILITKRYDVIGFVVANLLLLVVAGLIASWWLYRPIAQFEANRTGEEAAAERIQQLPSYSAWVAGCLVLIYSLTASALGVYTPPDVDLTQIPQQMIILAMLFYAGIFASFYSYFIYFFVNDLTIKMRRELRDLLSFVPSARQRSVRWNDVSISEGQTKGGLARKLAAIFFVIGVLPAVLLGLDLTFFAPIRAIQGLTTGNVIALDLIASLYVILASVVFVSRSLLAPTRELFDAQEAVRAGNLNYKAAVLTNDELGEVTARFNMMVGALRERDLIKSALHRYLSPTVANELIASGGMIASKSVEATVMFTDIEGFTTLSETLSPQETVDLLNAYFSMLNTIIHREGGTVNNFVGDAVVAIFNVPTPNTLHAYAAIKAALAIQQALSTERFILPTGRSVALPTRIGINTGPVCAGSIGSAERQGYTVYGDAVNLAARIEPLNKRYGTHILASESTIQLAAKQGLSPDRFTLLERTTVAGRSESVMVYRVDGVDGTITP